MSNTYLFDVDVAKEYGVDAAVMIKLFQFWIQKNLANETNFYDNNYWTYNSLDAFEKMLPFWTKKQITRILDFLIEKQVLIKGNYNRTKFDRTIWYAFKSPENWISRKGEIDIPKRGNGFPENGTPIPDINTFIPPDNNIIINNNILSAPPKGKGFVKPTVEEVEAYCKEKEFTFDPEQFVAYYESNGWMVGKSKMKNWKAACLTWQRNGYSKKEEPKEFYW